MMAWIRVQWWWVAAGIVAFGKIALLRSQHIYAIGGARHDDALFANLATQIVRGNWLGSYDQLTLSKGPAYPIFIALNFWAGMPLALTQQLLFVAACFVVVWALAPIVKSGWARFAIVAFLVLNPFTYEGATMTRLLRQHLTVPLAMVVAAGVLAVLIRRRGDWANRWPWAVLTGGALGVFWLSREEGIWIVPMVLVAAVALGVDSWQAGWVERRRWLITVALVILTSWAPIAAISFKNERQYGWYGTVDFRAPEFQELIGALIRVTTGPDYPYVQVSREAREAIYEVSPSFAELRFHLEEGPATAWFERNKYSAEERQYMTGWFNWALRDAMANAGKMESPREYLDFCAQIAAEINAACDAGTLPAVGPRSGFMPRWHPEFAVAMKREWARFLQEALRLDGFETIVPSSVGTDDDIRAFVDLSYDNLSPSLTATYFHKPDQLDLNRFKLDSLRALGNWTKDNFRWIFLIAGGLLLIRLVERAGRREWSWLSLMALIVLSGAMASLAVNFLVHTMAFEYFYPAVFAPAYPLLQLASVLVLMEVGGAWFKPAGGWLVERARARWSGLKLRRTAGQKT